jgi:DNA-binding GntR family transcriptional regulator
VGPIYPLKRPRTLTEQAADAIRSRIVSGDFQLGEALSEVTLASELGVSKTPVREAFLQLKNEGLVDIQPQRGTFVFQMTREQIRELTVYRELLEAGALRISMGIDAGRLAERLGEVVVHMEEAVAAGDSSHYRALDNDFHMHIIVTAGNHFLETAYSTIAFRVQALRNRICIEPLQNSRSLKEHQDVAAVVGTGNIDAAVGALTDHLRATMREYVKLAGGAQKF